MGRLKDSKNTDRGCPPSWQLPPRSTFFFHCCGTLGRCTNRVAKAGRTEIHVLQVEEDEVTWANERRNPSDVELVGFEPNMRVQG